MSGSDLLPASVLRRKAVVYVRQSTPGQVRENLESQPGSPARPSLRYRSAPAMAALRRLAAARSRQVFTSSTSRPPRPRRAAPKSPGFLRLSGRRNGRLVGWYQRRGSGHQRASCRCFRWASMSVMTAFASVFRSSVHKSSSSRFKSPRLPRSPQALVGRSGVPTTRRISPGEYTAPSRLIPSRVTRSQAKEPQAGIDRITGMRILSRLDVRFGPDNVRFTPKSGHSRDLGWSLLLTQRRHGHSRWKPSIGR